MSDFYADRDYLGHKFEESLLTAISNLHIPARLNPASEDDYQGRASHDIEIDAEGRKILIEAKFDMASGIYNNLCVEEATLNHSKSDFFIFGRVMPIVFTRLALRELYASFPKKMVGNPLHPASIIPVKAANNLAKPLWMWLRDKDYLSH